MSKKSKEEPKPAALEVGYDGKVYRIQESDITGIDSRDFRQIMGFGPMAVFANPAEKLDLDTVAALIWLVKRRGNPKIRWEDVAGEINMANIEINEVEEDSERDLDDPSNSE